MVMHRLITLPLINDLTVTGTINGTTTGNKVLPFDIPHPKKKGKRIRHIIAEGPEPGVYIRGRLKDTNIIISTRLLGWIG